MKKFRDFFDQGFIVLFFVLSLIMIITCILKSVIFTDFFINNELCLFYGSKSFLDLPLTLKLPTYLNFLDAFSFLLTIFILKKINDEIEKNYKKRLTINIWLSFFTMMLIGGMLNYFFGIFILLIIASIISLIGGFFVSVFVNKNKLFTVDGIGEIIAPFFLFIVANLIGVSLVNGFSIALLLILLYFIGIFILIMIFIVLVLVISWSLEGLKIFLRVIK